MMLFCIQLYGQKKQPIPIHIGLYAPYAFHPGIKIGTVFSLEDWQIEDGAITKSRSYYVSPQVGVFSRISNHTSYLLTTDLGYRRSSNDSKLYLATSIGLGFLMENQTLGSTVDLSNGTVTNKDKELRSYFLPTLNIEFGKESIRKLGWHSKFSYGRKISTPREDSGFFALELGLRLLIRQATQSSNATSNE